MIRTGYDSESWVVRRAARRNVGVPPNAIKIRGTPCRSAGKYRFLAWFPPGSHRETEPMG